MASVDSEVEIYFPLSDGPFWRFNIVCFQKILQAVKIGLPELFVVRDPVLRCVQRFRIQADHTAGSASFAANERGALQYVKMFGDCSERHAVRLGKFADRATSFWRWQRAACRWPARKAAV